MASALSRRARPLARHVRIWTCSAETARRRARWSFTARREGFDAVGGAWHQLMQCTQDSSARSVEEEDVRLLPPGVRAAAAVGAGGSGPWSPDPPRRVLLGRRRRGSSAAATPANHACGGRWRSTLRPQAAMRRQSAVAGMQRSSWPPDWRWPLSLDRGSAKATCSSRKPQGCSARPGSTSILSANR